MFNLIRIPPIPASFFIHYRRGYKVRRAILKLSGSDPIAVARGNETIKDFDDYFQLRPDDVLIYTRKERLKCKHSFL